MQIHAKRRIGTATTVAAAIFCVFSLTSMAAQPWWRNPVLKASMRLKTGITPSSYSDMNSRPHYMNKDADDKFLLVNLGSTSPLQPVLLYDFRLLTDLSGAHEDMPIAYADSTTLFRDDTSGYGFKGGAVSSRINVAIPGLAGSVMGLYNALITTNEAWSTGQVSKWVTNETAFCVKASSDVGADGLDFSTDGKFIYSNIYGQNDDRIVKWAYNSLTSVGETNMLTEVKRTMTGLSRVRNISVYQIEGRELVFFGEGRRSDTSARVCVLDVTDENDWKQYTLIDSPEMFLDDIMNVKVSGERTDSPVMYVCTDDSRMHIFSLARNGLALSSSTPLRIFEAEELSVLRGCSYGVQNWFRNFEVSRDGQFAFFLNDGGWYDYCPILRIVHCSDELDVASEEEPTDSIGNDYANIWGGWSVGSAESYKVPDSVATWDELSRVLWRARDAYVRSGVRTEVPPSDDAVVLSLGAMSVPDSLMTSQTPIETEVEHDVSVWRLRVFEDTNTCSLVAVAGKTTFELSTLPSYLAKAWVNAVYGQHPAWLDANETEAWYAARSRSRIEWFLTLVPQSQWDAYCANRAVEAGETRTRGANDSLVITSFRPDSATAIHNVSVRSSAAGETRLWSKGGFSNTNWTYNGYSMQAQGTTAAGIYSVSNQVFVMAMFSEIALDSDGDGIPDVMEEKVYGTNPNKADSSGDGISDWEKVYRYDLNPRVQDTAGDGIGDDEKILSGINPRIPLTSEQKAAASRSIRYTYDDDDRLTGTFFGLGGASIKTELTPAGNPADIRNRNATK